ncbi:hypothetical protein CVD28_04745 [Bacillus sp. M6-12]|uniref:hypothetical protein n=1 Tax=Bacillus sp. M6-12 TaxID=2054166 RepID=UPI000C756828|nr:hypothetical protein [Bacillus sp. M6-12]PLS19724.1 hypothetical protein CVD28_04745 [Bacillus sp. M6-12]
MKKKWKTATLAVTGVALVANPYTLNLLGLESIANTLYYSQDDELYDQQLKEAKEAVDKAKQTALEADVKKAIDTLIELPWSSGYKSEEKDNLLDEMFFWIDGLSDNDAKVKYGLYFVDTSINRVTESLIEPDYKLAHALVFELPEGKIKDKYMTILEATDKTMGENLLEYFKNDPQGIPNYGFDWSRLPGEVFAPYIDVDTGDYKVGYPLPDKETPKPNPDALPEEDFTLEYEYQTVGSKCYKVTTKTVEGKNSTVSKELVTGYDATFCTVLIVDNDDGHNGTESPYDFSKVQPSPAGSGMNLNGGVSDNSSYFGNSGNTSSQETANTSNLTLQYTLDRTEKEPYFYETDMIVSKDGTITYQQQRDVLFQLAIRSGGKAVEDKDRFLVLLENKIIVVQNKGDKIGVSSFESILKGFKAQVKAMERTTGTE